MIILDTNVVSEAMHLTPERRVLDWLDSQRWDDVYITAMTAAELRAGVATLPHGRRREEIDAQVESVITGQFARRVAPFDVESSAAYAAIVAARRAIGRPISVSDAQIAAIARARGATVATRNVPDFEGCGVEIVDPWDV